MIRGSGKRIAWGIAVLLCASPLAPAAQAEDFLSGLFGACGGGRSHAPSDPLPFASEGNPFAPQGDALTTQKAVVRITAFSSADTVKRFSIMAPQFRPFGTKRVNV